MKKLIGYKILSASCAEDLETEVEISLMDNNSKFKGYQLYGQPWCAKNRSEITKFYQAIVKYEEEENKVI